MKKQKTYLWFTLVLSVLLGIILPPILGVKDLDTIALIFSAIWAIYIIVRFVTVFFSSDTLKLRNFIGKK